MDDDDRTREETPADPGEVFLTAEAACHHDVAGLHRERFAGLPLKALHEVDDPSERVAWALCGESGPGHDEAGSTLANELDRLLESVDPARVEALAVLTDGAGTAAELAANAHRLPALRSVFLGLIEAEHWEISWIRQGDITPLLQAYPRLERLDVRGSDGLTLSAVTHEHLRVLRFECGGLPGAVVRAVGASAFPALEHLELWLGVESYGGDHTIADLDGILAGARLPALKRLGLRNSEQQDEVAAAVAAAPVLARLEALSLGMGVLSDRGAEALLSGQPLSHLSVLDLNHHFLSDAMTDRVRRALPGVAVDLGDRQPTEPHGWRYTAVSE
ncbi:STM4015 family protein [Nonomuraea sp. NPDC050643]|uniref:STM4015 family protein n=1 Tax=Nonomuraea sp. NPDC050643 TaxID=3155660 RepID=UPI0033DD4DC7